jgi:hypothetical protein
MVSKRSNVCYLKGNRCIYSLARSRLTKKLVIRIRGEPRLNIQRNSSCPLHRNRPLISPRRDYDHPEVLQNYPCSYRLGFYLWSGISTVRASRRAGHRLRRERRCGFGRRCHADQHGQRRQAPREDGYRRALQYSDCGPGTLCDHSCGVGLLSGVHQRTDDSAR